jgi:glycine C-acetyltransferase
VAPHLDDRLARRDWDWRPRYDLARMTDDLVPKLRALIQAAHSEPAKQKAEEFMFDRARDHYAAMLKEIRDAGLYKHERLISSPQSAEISVQGRTVLNFCANNYLGLSSHPAVIAAAHAALDDRGFGMSSVRFICGTQDRHRELEARLAAFVGTEDAILYSSCFDANGGLFETLLGPEDAIISDALNHASIIDGIRLCKAERHRYANDDLNQLEKFLNRPRPPACG